MLDENELLFDELYEKTKKYGRTQFIRLLMSKEQENKHCKEDLKAVNKGLRKVLSKRKKWETKYLKERLKNQQLKSQLQQRDELIDELEKWLNQEWEQPGIKIYVSDVVKKLNELKGDNK